MSGSSRGSLTKGLALGLFALGLYLLLGGTFRSPHAAASLAKSGMATKANAPAKVYAPSTREIETIEVGARGGLPTRLRRQDHHLVEA